jgi:hypothetical protein
MAFCCTRAAALGILRAPPPGGLASTRPSRRSRSLPMLQLSCCALRHVHETVSDAARSVIDAHVADDDPFVLFAILAVGVAHPRLPATKGMWCSGRRRRCRGRRTRRRPGGAYSCRCVRGRRRGVCRPRDRRGSLRCARAVTPAGATPAAIPGARRRHRYGPRHDHHRSK